MNKKILKRALPVGNGGTEMKSMSSRLPFDECDSTLNCELTLYCDAITIDYLKNHEAGIPRLMEEACRLQITRLYLWTPSADGLYAKFGWVSLERLDCCGYKISIKGVAQLIFNTTHSMS